MKRMISWKTFTVAVVAVLGLFLACPAVYAAKGKPNILVIWGDDVGYWNVSAYNQGMMGYKTPNIDSLANDGALFTDWYASRAVPPGGRLLSSASTPSVRDCSPSGCPARTKGSATKW